MKTFVEINIFGIALCYRKPRENWKVLIPWNGCHRALFNYGPYEGPASIPISLGVPNQRVKITASNPITSSGQSGSFEREVFDFTTNFAASGYGTHENLFLRDDWAQGTVLLELDNAFFSVEDYVQIRTTERVYRNGKDLGGGTLPGEEITYNIAHSLRAQITLNDGGVLTVARTLGIPTQLARISGGGTYIMTFNNDCNEMTHDRNDMFLYYEKIICGGTRANPRPNERFWVGAVGTLDKNESEMEKLRPEETGYVDLPEGAVEVGTGYVILSEGKPCMGAQVSPAPPDFP